MKREQEGGHGKALGRMARGGPPLSYGPMPCSRLMYPIDQMLRLTWRRCRLRSTGCPLARGWRARWWWAPRSDSTAARNARWLLDQTGKGQGSFAVLDLMRLPLGILTGMGFIGAGAVFRKDGLVTGVTTAAMLWFVTVVGLCFGGGQYRLGAVGSVVGLAVLWGLRFVEHRLERRKAAWLTLRYAVDSDGSHRLAEQLAKLGCRVELRGAHVEEHDGTCTCEFRYLVHWRERFDVHRIAPSFDPIGRASGARCVQWAMAD